MNRSKTTLLIVALGIIIPASAVAGNVRVRAGDVRATTNSNGSVYVNTGKTLLVSPLVVLGIPGVIGAHLGKVAVAKVLINRQAKLVVLMAK